MKKTILTITFSLLLLSNVFSQPNFKYSAYFNAGIGGTNTFINDKLSRDLMNLSFLPLLSEEIGIGHKLNIIPPLSIGNEIFFQSKGIRIESGQAHFYSLMIPIYIQFEDKKSSFGLGITQNINFKSIKMTQELWDMSYKKYNNSVLIFWEIYLKQKFSIKPFITFDFTTYNKNPISITFPHDSYAYNFMISINYYLK